MDECNLQAEETEAGLCVDQLRTSGDEAAQRNGNIVDLVRDVMHAGPTFREEPPDRCVRVGRREQLDPIPTDQNGRCDDTLLEERLAVLDRGAEQPLVGRNRPVEIGDRNAEMMDASRLHAGAIVSGRC